MKRTDNAQQKRLQLVIRWIQRKSEQPNGRENKTRIGELNTFK